MRGRGLIKIGLKRHSRFSPRVVQRLWGVSLLVALAAGYVSWPAAGSSSPTTGPWTLPFSTYLGGARADGASDVAVDPAGDIYVTGWTSSAEFPVRNPLIKAYRGGACASVFTSTPCGDAFVSKFSGADHSLVYSTYLGGAGIDYASGIAVDAAGAAYVTGTTDSTDFPLTKSIQPGRDKCSTGLAARPCSYAFVTKINPAGGAVVFSTLLGGPGEASGGDISVDPAGNSYVTGAAGPGLTTTGGVFQQENRGPKDAFVAKINPEGSGLIYSTYLGGSASDSAGGIAVDPSGSAYVTGQTTSGDFPTSNPIQARPPQTNCAGKDKPSKPCGHAFVAKFNPAGSDLSYSTYLAGAGADAGSAVALDAKGSAYVAGSASSGFPLNQSSIPGFQPLIQGGSDAFVFKLSASGQVVEYSTYIGGPDDDSAASLALDKAGRVYVSGTAGRGMPLKGAFQDFAGRSDAFVAVIDPSKREAASLVRSTYLGGTARDHGAGLVLDSSGRILLAGYTDSLSNFPVLGAARAAGDGRLDAFVATIATANQGAPAVTGLVPKSGPASGGTEVVITGAGFDGATAVRFGGALGTDLKVGAEGRKITVRTPPHSKGLSDIRVTTRQGVSGPAPGAGFLYAEGVWRRIKGPRRFGHTATLLPDGKVLIAGGCTQVDSGDACIPGSATASTEIFNPATGAWKKAGSLSKARFGHIAVLLPTEPQSLCGDNCGKMLILGGADESGELYDPRTGKSRLIDPPQDALPNSLIAAALPSAPQAVCGGNCGKVLLASRPLSYLFDPRTASWAITGNDTEIDQRRAAGDRQADGAFITRLTRYNHTATVMKDGKVLLSGTASELYDPLTGTSSQTPPPAIPRYLAPTATLLPTGSVLLAGGITDNIGTMTFAAELYEPGRQGAPPAEAKGRWKPAAPLAAGRFSHTAVLLQNGKVLVVGGSDSLGDPGTKITLGNRLAGAELYDPSTGRWESAGQMNDPRGGGIAYKGNDPQTRPSFTATLLKDGKVLVAGGADSAEIYDPSGRSNTPSLRKTPASKSPGGGVPVNTWVAIGAAALLGLAAVALIAKRARR